MPSRKKISEEEELTTPRIFDGTWVWGFVFGWVSLIIALISIRFNGNFPVFVFVILLAYLIIINLSRVLKTVTNSTYGILSLISLIVSVVDIFLAIILK